MREGPCTRLAPVDSTVPLLLLQCGYVWLLALPESPAVAAGGSWLQAAEGPLPRVLARGVWEVEAVWTLLLVGPRRGCGPLSMPLDPLALLL